MGEAWARGADGFLLRLWEEDVVARAEDKAARGGGEQGVERAVLGPGLQRHVLDAELFRLSLLEI